MADIKCVLWNCSGILAGGSSGEKVDLLFSSINSGFDVLALVETHHVDINDIHSSFHTFRNSYHLLHTGADDGDPYAGIIVLVNKSLRVSGERVGMPGRVLNFKIGGRGEDYNVSVVYGFTGANATQSKVRGMVELIMS